MEAKEKILLEAARLFSKKGFADAGTDEIILNSGTSKGLLFYHYKSKEGLLTAVLERSWEIIAASCTVDASDKSAGIVMRKLIKQLTGSLKRNNDFWKVYTAVLLNHYRLGNLDFTASSPSEKYVEMAEGLFREMGRKNPERWAFSFDIHFKGICFGYLAEPKTFPLQKGTQVMVDMFTR